MNYSIMTTFSAILSCATYPMFKSFIHVWIVQFTRHMLSLYTTLCSTRVQLHPIYIPS